MPFYDFLKLTVLLAGAGLFLAGPAFAQGAFDDPGARRGSGGSGGDLSAVSSKVDGGTVALGSSSQVVVLFRNDDIKPLTIGDISLYPSSNVSASISQNQCSLEPLASGAVCATAISVKGLQAGKYRIEMLIKHEGRSRLLTATVSGEVESSGEGSRELISDIETIPSELDFGSLKDSRPLVKSVILRNITSNPVTISDVSIQAGTQSGYSLETDCGELQTGQACLATVTWSPLQKGPATGILLVEHDGPTSIASVPLEGEYEPGKPTAAETFPEAVPGKGLLVSSLDEVDFGNDIESSSAITVSLVNTGDAPLTIRNIQLSNNENGVEILSSGCKVGTVLEPVEACPLTLTWEPAREGSILDDVQVLHTGARGILVLPLRGTASKAVNKDSKAIVLGDGAVLRPIPPISESDLGESSGSAGRGSRGGGAGDARGALDGYAITSHGSDRAIISGPGGSRVVFDGEETVIGGFLWRASIRPSAIEFSNGDQKVLLLFDRSLSSNSSSVNQNKGQSSGSSSSTETTSAN